MKSLLSGLFGIVAALALTYGGVQALSKKAVDSADKMGQEVGRIVNIAEAGEKNLKQSQARADELTAKLEMMEVQASEQLKILEEQKKSLVELSDQINEITSQTELLSDQESLKKLEQITKFSKNLSSTSAIDRLASLEAKLTDVSGKYFQNNNTSCFKNETYQICWGSEDISRNEKAPHTATFNFKYPIPFGSIPTITNGINFKSSGWMADVYTWDKENAEKYYKGSLNNNHKWGVAFPAGNIITMQFVAIGKPKVQ